MASRLSPQISSVLVLNKTFTVLTIPRDKRANPKVELRQLEAAIGLQKSHKNHLHRNTTPQGILPRLQTVFLHQNKRDINTTSHKYRTGLLQTKQTTWIQRWVNITKIWSPTWRAWHLEILVRWLQWHWYGILQTLPKAMSYTIHHSNDQANTKKWAM